MNYDFKRAFLMAKYIGWEPKPFEMIYVLQNKNPLDYYRLSSKRLFLKVMCIMPDENDVTAFKSALRANKFEFEHNNHLLSADMAERWLIAKFYKYGSVIKSSYSLKNLSSYDVIWLVERDTLSLKKRLSKCFSRLPPDIPKLAIVSNVEAETNKSFVFRNFGIRVIIALNKSAFSDMDKDKRRELVQESFELLKNPELGLTQDFVSEYSYKVNYTVPIILGLLGVGCLALIAYRLKSQRVSA